MLRIGLLGVLLAALLVGCGGGESHDLIAEGMRAEAHSGPRRQALAVPAGADPVAGATRLLDYAESAFPQLFAGRESNRILSGVIYRYYPQTSIYLAVIDWRVYAMGGPLGPEIRDFGPLENYVSIDVPIGNSAPTVALSPIIGGPFTAPASITLSAAAVDSDGFVARVAFRASGVLIGEATRAPWSIVWRNVSAGTYSITAEATDDRGATTTSAAASLRVTAQNQPPTVSVLAPTTALEGQVTISATATDPDGSIAFVEFFVGSTKIGEDSSSPYGISWFPVAGTYSVYAVATDNLGLKTFSEVKSTTITSAAPSLASLYGRLTFTYTFGANWTDVVNYSAGNRSGEFLVNTMVGSSRLMACGLSTVSGYQYFCLARYSSGSSDQYLFNIIGGRVVGNYNFCTSTTATSQCASDLLTRPDAPLSGSHAPGGLAVPGAVQEEHPDLEKVKRALKDQMPVRPLDASHDVEALARQMTR